MLKALNHLTLSKPFSCLLFTAQGEILQRKKEKNLSGLSLNHNVQLLQKHFLENANRLCYILHILTTVNPISKTHLENNLPLLCGGQVRFPFSFLCCVIFLQYATEFFQQDSEDNQSSTHAFIFYILILTLCPKGFGRKNFMWYSFFVCNKAESSLSGQLLNLILSQ